MAGAALKARISALKRMKKHDDRKCTNVCLTMAGMRVEVGLQEKWTNLAPFLYRLKNNCLLKVAIPAWKIVISY
jgi:hypothetical protein